MKMLFILTLFCGLSSPAQSLTGMWKFSGYIYDGQIQPPLNPDLDLRFIFYSNGYSKLRWFRHHENGFCERKAIFKVEGSILHQKTIWLNPGNDRSCANDPEMRPRSETYTPFRIEKNQLFLDLGLDDKPFIYIFNFLPDELPDESSLMNR